MPPRLLLPAGLFALLAPAAAQDAAAPAAREPLPGLVLTLEGAGGATDARTTRLAALHVPAGSPPSPWLPTGPFRATLTGRLTLDLRTRLRFSAEGRGRIRLSVGGKVLLEGGGGDLAEVTGKRGRVRKGANAFVLEYASPPEGDARLRLFWEGSDFKREPVPPAVLSHVPAGELLHRRARARRGRELLAAHRCLSCHGAPGLGDVPASGMPELAADIPTLEGVGARLLTGWMEAWIRDPHAFRRDARMPALLGGDEDAARDIAAYLATLGEARDAAPAPDPRLAPAGGALFADLGCIACHTRPGRAQASDDDRIPLAHVARKYRPGALAAFLRDPRRHHAWSRMPDFGLEPGEAGALAAFLRSEAPAPGAAPSPGGDPGRGRELLSSEGCLDCHDRPATRPRSAPPLAAGRARGCLTEEAAARGGAPDFRFDAEERDALGALLSEGLASLARRSQAEAAWRLVRALRCTACHGLDGEPGAWSLLATETADVQEEREGEVDQFRPALTWTGGRLHAAWMERLFAGGLEERTRPWLHARMPAFPARAGVLARGLAASHGIAPGAAPEPDPDPALVKPGAFLISGPGFGCTACHALGEKPPDLVFEVKGPNFDVSYERLRHDFYLRWMRDPRRIDPGSRMPLYEDQDGLTRIDDVLEGDAERQYEAMWHYLMTLR